ncbi:hypothetical protein Q9189_003184 [Teloschistes chrysophthalmus]
MVDVPCLETAMTSYEASPMAGGAACYYDGLVYPDDGNTYALPPGWTQFLHNATNGSSTTTTSTTSTISMNLLIRFP